MTEEGAQVTMRPSPCGIPAGLEDKRPGQGKRREPDVPGGFQTESHDDILDV